MIMNQYRVRNHKRDCDIFLLCLQGNTQEQIGIRFGRCRARIGQIIRNIERRLRHTAYWDGTEIERQHYLRAGPAPIGYLRQHRDVWIRSLHKYARAKGL